MSSRNLKTRQVCLKVRSSYQQQKVVYKPTIRSLFPPSFKPIGDVDNVDVNENSSVSKKSKKIKFLIGLLRCGLHEVSRLDSLPLWADVIITCINNSVVIPFDVNRPYAGSYTSSY